MDAKQHTASCSQKALMNFKENRITSLIPSLHIFLQVNWKSSNKSRAETPPPVGDPLVQRKGRLATGNTVEGPDLHAEVRTLYRHVGCSRRIADEPVPRSTAS